MIGIIKYGCRYLEEMYGLDMTLIPKYFHSLGQFANNTQQCSTVTMGEKSKNRLAKVCGWLSLFTISYLYVALNTHYM